MTTRNEAVGRRPRRARRIARGIPAIACALALAACAADAPTAPAGPRPFALFKREARAPAYLVVKKSRGADRVEQLDGITVCGRPNGGLADNRPIIELLARHGLGFNIVMYPLPRPQLDAFDAGRCDALAIYDYYDKARAERIYDDKTYRAIPMREDPRNRPGP
jgi:hypothetical protein